MIPTHLANVILRGRPAIAGQEIDGTAFRLIGIGVSGIEVADGTDPDRPARNGNRPQSAAERAMDRVRTRFGRDAVVRGKLYRLKPVTIRPRPMQVRNRPWTCLNTTNRR